MQRSHPVYAQTGRARPAARDSDMDRRARAPMDLPEPSRRLVTEKRVAAAGEDAGPASAEPAQGSMADRVDADVERLEPAGTDESLNSAVAQPAFDQLPMRNHTVLPPRQLRDPMTWAVWRSDIDFETAHVRHGDHLARRHVTAGSQAQRVGDKPATK